MKKEIKILIYLITFEVFIFIFQMIYKIKPQSLALILLCLASIFVFYYFKIYNLENKREDFISNLIHDFKNPIIAQIRITDLLLNKKFGELTGQQTEIIKEIKNSCEYLNGLILTVFDTYINRNGEIDIKYNLVNIKELSQNIISEVSSLIENKKQNIILQSNIKEETLYVDILQMKRVIMNLVCNAITHGNYNTDIYIMLDEDDKNIIFSIKNKADFKNKKPLNELFQKHNSTKKNDKTSCGLGLYLSQEIIKKHKGKMFITNSQKDFYTFGFVIPKGKEIMAKKLCLK